MRQTIIVRGTLGVGKSTVAKGVAEEFSGFYLSVGEVMKENGLDALGEKHIPIENYLKANEIIEIMVKMKEGIVVIDGSFYYKEQLKDLKKRLGKPFIVITLSASLSTCIKRDVLREDSQGKDATMRAHNLASLYKTGIIVDTEEKSRGGVLDEVIKKLEKELEK